MGAVLDQLRNWRERHPDSTSGDWRVAQGNGWKRDLDESDVIADGRRMEAEADTRNAMEHMKAETSRLDNTAAAERVGAINPDRFIERRPKADRLVYVLLRQLEQINPVDGARGRTWYDANRERLTVDEGSNWITRIRAKIAEGAVSAPVEQVEAALEVTRPERGVWAEFRELAKDILAQVDAIDTGARFAVRNADGADNDYGFWAIVNRPAKGSTLPRYYFRQYLGGQGMVRVTMHPEAMITILKRIRDAGPREAMLKFGELLEKCGDCGRDLTNTESRALRVGPKCRARHAWLG